MSQKQSLLSAATIRLLAVMSRADPRTVKKVLTGQSVRGLSAIRVRDALESIGIKTGHEVDDALIREAIRNLERRTLSVGQIIDSEFDD